jgi:hypothetical protein
VNELLWTEEDNARLRRVDWRLLLPSPTPSRSACLADGLLGDAVVLISKQTGADLNVQDACDLVVAVDPDVSTLRAAQTALVPGAWCYMEWRTPFRAGLHRIRRKLNAAGFSDVAFYRPWPTPDRVRFWLPLDSRAAQRHVRQLQRGGRTLIRRAGRLLLGVLSRAAGRTPLFQSVCAVARKSPASTLDAQSGDRALLERVQEGWSAWGLGAAPRRLSCLLVAEGQRSISKCVALVFAESDARPRLAIKLPRVPEAIPALAREAMNLRTLHARHPDAFPGIPRIVFEEQRGPRTLLGETALIGTPLRAFIRRGAYRELALKATEWLAAFARRTARRASSSWQERIGAPALADFSSRFGEVVDARLVRRTRELLESLGPLPVVAEQRDFSPWNVLMGPRGELIVLDWESAELDGLPVLDLIYFLTYLACDFERVPFDTASDRLRESYRRALDPASFTGRVRAECLARYAIELGLDTASLPALAVLAWLIHSRSDYRSFTADAGGPPDRTVLGRSVFLSFWEEEIQFAMRTAQEGSPTPYPPKSLAQPFGRLACTPRS